MAITHQKSLKAWLCPLKTPKQVEKMTRGSYDHRFEINDEVLIVRWKDNKAVGIASNFDTILPEVWFSPGPVKAKHASQLCSLM